MIKGLIFDFDGTLANTLPVIFASFDYATEKVFGHTRSLYRNFRAAVTAVFNPFVRGRNRRADLPDLSGLSGSAPR